MIKRLGYQTLWRLGLIGLLALTTAACGRDSDQSAPPVTEPTASFTQQVAGLTVSLDASGSTGDIASYQWDFGDGATGTGKSASHRLKPVAISSSQLYRVKGYKESMTVSVPCLFDPCRPSWDSP